MRITFFVPRCTTDNSHGRYVIELVRRLSVHHELTIYAGAFLPELRSMARCKFVPVPNRPAMARLGAMWAASTFLRDSTSADIVHVQGADTPIGDVVTAHCCNAAMGLAANGVGRSVSRRSNYLLGSAAERHCFTRASTRVIAVSHKVRTEIEAHYGVDGDKVTVIHNGVNTHEFHPSNRDRCRLRVREQLGLGPRDFTVLFVGGDYRLKGLVTLLKAAAEVEKCTVVAAGMKADTILQHIVEHESLAGRVRFLGVVRAMAPLYAAADCFALPTRYDACSLATLEALASGLPAIVSKEDGVTEFLTNGQDSVVLESAAEVGAVADAFRRLSDDEELRDEMGKAARRTAEQHSWDRVVERTVKVYGEVMRRG